jgi:hypothetical protein
LPHREHSHVAALAPSIAAASVAGLAGAHEHLGGYPRDAMVLASCTGREVELLAFLDAFAALCVDLLSMRRIAYASPATARRLRS